MTRFALQASPDIDHFAWVFQRSEPGADETRRIPSCENVTDCSQDLVVKSNELPQHGNFLQEDFLNLKTGTRQPTAHRTLAFAAARARPVQAQRFIPGTQAKRDRVNPVRALQTTPRKHATQARDAWAPGGILEKQIVFARTTATHTHAAVAIMCGA